MQESDKRRRAAAPGRPRAGRPSKSLAARIAGISPRMAIMAVLVVMFAALSVAPVTRNLEATSRLRKLQSELKEEQAVTEALQGDVAEAGTLEYVEKEARRQRLVAPGEVLYLVTTDSRGDDIEYRVKSIQSIEEARSRVRRMLYSVPRGQ